MVDLRKCVTVGCRASLGLLVACGTALAQPPEPDVHFRSLSPQDAAFLEDLQRADRQAIAAGKVALARAREEAVKKYAQLVVDTHSKLLEDGAKLAKLKRLDLPADAKSNDGPVLPLLEPVPDDRFDRAYVEWTVQAQGGAYKAARRAASEARDPNVKALAANAAAHIEKQLEIARELARSLDAPPKKTPLGDTRRGDIFVDRRARRARCRRAVARVSGADNSPSMNTGKNALPVL